MFFHLFIIIVDISCLGSLGDVRCAQVLLRVIAHVASVRDKIFDRMFDKMFAKLAMPEPKTVAESDIDIMLASRPK